MLIIVYKTAIVCQLINGCRLVVKVNVKLGAYFATQEIQANLSNDEKKQCTWFFIFNEFFIHLILHLGRLITETM